MARFASAEDAEKVCKYFALNHKIPELGGSRLYLQRLFSMKYTVPLQVFEGIRDELSAILRNSKNIRYNFVDNGKSWSISVQTNDSDSALDWHTRLDPLFHGDVVRDFGSRKLWNRHVAALNFCTVSLDLCEKNKLLILSDRRRQEVRVFGAPGHQGRAMENVRKYGADGEFEYLLCNGRETINKVTAASSARKVSLDVKNHALLVEGNSVEATRAKAYVNKLANRKTSLAAADELCCSIWFCQPDEKHIELSYKHTYCQECFETWLGKGTIRDFPLVCLD